MIICFARPVWVWKNCQNLRSEWPLWFVLMDTPMDTKLSSILNSLTNMLVRSPCPWSLVCRSANGGQWSPYYAQYNWKTIPKRDPRNSKRNVSVFLNLNLLVHSKDQIENIRYNSLIQISTTSLIITLPASIL